MVRTGQPAPPAELTMVRADGTKRRVRVVACPTVDRGKPAFVVVCHDLSDMKRTEGLLRSVLESVTDAILTTDATGRIQTVNPAAARLFGFDAGELVGSDVDTLLAANEHVLGDTAASGGSSAPMAISRELVGKRSDGETFPIELSVTCFRRDGVPHFTAVMRDITERKRLEEQFRQAHKMEAFGQLAGGVAHDFNNLLTAILATTDMLVSGLPAEDPAVASLGEIYDAGQRAAALTRQLLAFSRKTVLEPKTLDVNEVIRETERMLGRLLGEDVSLLTKLAPNLSYVHVDPGQLSQVVINLAVNARDAMPKGGELVVSTSNTHSSRDPTRACVLISVRDTGEGMSEEVRSQVFQPFFTTKGVGKGTGLGLAVVHGIVTQSGGHIELHTAPGRGTTFDIYLPAFAEAAVGRSQRAEPSGDVSGTEVVVLVEDDAAVRRVAERVLSKKGYRVLSAPDAAEAIRVLEQGVRVDVVLTDVVMPGMDGGHLGAIVSARFPSTKVLYTSGYTDEILVRRGLQADRVAFLAKPYSPAALALAVRTVLDQR